MESVYESVHRFPHPPVFFLPAHWTTGANAKQCRAVAFEANPAPDEFKPQSSDPLGRMAAGNTMSHDLAIRGGLGLGGGGHRSAQ
jgi:hypothetical protein